MVLWLIELSKQTLLYNGLAPMKKIKPNYPLILVLIFASFIRFWSPNKYPPSLFSDEVDVALQVKSFLATGADYYGNFLPLQFHSFSDVRTALPIYFTALIAKVTGNIELAVRLEPAIMGVLGVLGLYLLVNQLFPKSQISNIKSQINVGHFAALLLALTPWHLTYSRVGFEVTTLFAFFVFGLYFLKKYFDSRSSSHLFLSLFLFSLTPLIYSTAKLSLFFLPVLILFFPSTSFKKNIRSQGLLVGLLLMFVPLIIVAVSGGATSRFDYISIFSDPTIPPELNVARKGDQGEDLPVGTKPLFLSQVFRNKYVVYGQRITNNLFSVISSDFLFVKGDLNLRHALPDWGMLYKTEGILILFGLYALTKYAREKNYQNIIFFFIILTALAIAPGSLTRDGGTHATRSFLLLIPLITLASLGAIEIVTHSRFLLLLLVPLLIFESSFYFFDYFHRYVFFSERQWHSGLKQVVLSANKQTGPVVITNSYEPPLIFYLFYSDYPLSTMQQLIKTDSLLTEIPPSYNLGGRKLANREVYFANIDDKNLSDPLKVKSATYYLTEPDLTNHLDYKTRATTVIKLPSGLPLFYEIKTL